MFKFNLKTIIFSAIGLFLIFLIGTLFFFNAIPEPKRVTMPIGYSYSVKDSAFKTNSGIFTGRRWVEGNDAIILSMGEDIFNTMYEDIRNAHHSISKETFVYSGEVVATTMAHELADASERGVNVHFIMDYVGSAEATTTYAVWQIGSLSRVDFLPAKTIPLIIVNASYRPVYQQFRKIGAAQTS